MRVVVTGTGGNVGTAALRRAGRVETRRHRRGGAAPRRDDESALPSCSAADVTTHQLEPAL
jgi:hypothetical protein